MNIKPESIKAARIKAGLGISAFARLMGVSRMTVYNWEKGLHPMNKRDRAYMRSKLK